MLEVQHTRRALADAVPHRSDPTRAVRDDEDRRELARLHAGMCATGRRRKIGRRATRLNEVTREPVRFHPAWELVLDARAAADAGEPREAVRAPFERMLALVDACYGAAPLPEVSALDLDETRHESDANVAVRAFVVEPPTSPRKRDLIGTAIRALTGHRQSVQRLEDRLREERVLRFPPQPTVMRGGR